MDFQTLLSQLSTLEEQNKREEQRYFSELSSHEYTKKQLAQVEEKLENQRKKEISLLEKITRTEYDNQQQAKRISELQQELSASYKNIELVNERYNKETTIMRQKRDEFITTIERLTKFLRVAVKNQDHEELLQKFTNLQDNFEKLQQSQENDTK